MNLTARLGKLPSVIFRMVPILHRLNGLIDMAQMAQQNACHIMLRNADSESSTTTTHGVATKQKTAYQRKQKKRENVNHAKKQ